MKGFVGFLYILVSRWAFECSWRSTARGVLFTEISRQLTLILNAKEARRLRLGSSSIASEGFLNATLSIPKGFEYSWNVCIADEDRT